MHIDFIFLHLFSLELLISIITFLIFTFIVKKKSFTDLEFLITCVLYNFGFQTLKNKEMNSTELTIEVVYESPYWVVLFEKVYKNRKWFARKRLGKSEPKQTELSQFFENLNYKKLRYVPI